MFSTNNIQVIDISGQHEMRAPCSIGKNHQVQGKTVAVEALHLCVFSENLQLAVDFHLRNKSSARGHSARCS